MRWSDLQPQVRAAILVGGFVIAVVLVWVLFVAPMREREARLRAEIASSEAQLGRMEREIESIPPAPAEEVAAWQASEDELLSRLGPESDLPLFIESVVRLAETEGLEIFLTSETAGTLGDPGAGGGSLSETVIGAVPGAQFVPLNVRLYGDYAATGRFISQVGLLGRVVEVAGLHQQRAFPELHTDMRLIVFFRPSDADNGNGTAARSGGVPGQGGMGNG